MMKRGHGKRYIGTERIVYETLAVSVKRREVVTGFARVVVTTAGLQWRGRCRRPAGGSSTGHEDRFPVARSRSLIVAAGGSAIGLSLSSFGVI